MSHAAFVLFVAVPLSITAVPVLAGIIKERGLSGTMVGVEAMTAAWVTVVFGLHVIFGAFVGGPIMPCHEICHPDPAPLTAVEKAGGVLLSIFYVVSGRVRRPSFTRKMAGRLRGESPNMRRYSSAR